MKKKCTFQTYWKALDPADPPSLKERILHQAYHDPSIDCLEYKRLLIRAYGDFD